MVVVSVRIVMWHYTHKYIQIPVYTLIGSLSKPRRHGNENVTKTKGLMIRTIAVHVRVNL